MKNRGKFPRIFLGLLGILLGFSLVFAQAVHYGKLVGKITTKDGQSLAGVTVTLFGDALVKGQVSTRTDKNGDYVFLELPVGKYSIKATLPGFKTVVRKNVFILAGRTIRVDLTMEPGEIKETMVVEAFAPMIDVRSASTDQAITDEMLKSLPTRRDAFYDLAISTPGMFEVGSESSWLPSPTAYGSATNENIFLVNGVNTTNPRGGAWGSLVNVNYSTVKEVRIIALGSKAEYGNFSGVAIDVITKSGSNNFHGDIGIFSKIGKSPNNQPSSKDLGRDWLWIAEGDNVFKEPKTQAEFSATLGGPIKKNALWFYTGIDYVDDANKVPFFEPTKEYIGRYFDFKLTAQPGYNHRAWISYHFEANKNLNESWGTLNWDPTVVYNPKFFTHSIAGQWEWNISGATTFSIKYLGFWSDEKPYLPDNAPDHPAYINWWKWINKDLGVNGSFHAVEAQKSSRHTVQADISHYADNFLGQHDMKMGVQYTRGRGDWLGGWFHGYANYAYPYRWTQNIQYMQSWYGDTGFLMYVRQPHNPPYLTVRTSDSLGLFFDDEWTIGDRLTLNIGFRYDRMTSRFGEGKIYVQPDDPNKINEAQVLRKRKGSKNIFDFKTFSPRLGLAYMLTKDAKTVIRASYGRYYVPISVENLGYGGPDMPLVSIDWYLYSIPFSQVDINGNGIIDSDEVVLATRMLYGLTPISHWTSQEDPSYNLNVDPNLKNQFTDQFTVTFEREILPDLKFSVSYIYKKSKNIIVRWPMDKITGKQWQTIRIPYTTDEGKTIELVAVPLSDFNGDGKVDGSDIEYFYNSGNYEWRNLPTFDGIEPHRTYKGLQFVLTKRFSHRWQMLASFLYSTSDGIAARNKRQDEDLNMEGPNLLNDAWIGDFNQLVNNMTGPLPFVPKYEFKLNGSYTIPKIELTLGFRFRYNSGRPIWKLEDVDPAKISGYTLLHSWDQWNDTFPSNSILFCSDNVQLVSVDVNHPQYLPPAKILDLHMSRSFKVFKGSLDLGLDVLNVFNSGVVTNALVKGDSFGRVTGIIYPPRLIRFNANFSF